MVLLPLVAAKITRLPRKKENMTSTILTMESLPRILTRSAIFTPPHHHHFHKR